MKGAWERFLGSLTLGAASPWLLAPPLALVILVVISAFALV